MNLCIFIATVYKHDKQKTNQNSSRWIESKKKKKKKRHITVTAELNVLQNKM